MAAGNGVAVRTVKPVSVEPHGQLVTVQQHAQAQAQTAASRPESLTHAINRMRAQGFSADHIYGQIKAWHPNWSSEDISSHLIHNIQNGDATNQQALQAAHTVQQSRLWQSPVTAPFDG